MAQLTLFFSILILFLGVIVYFKNKKDKNNLSFSIFAAISGVWLFSNFLLRTTHTDFNSRLAYGMGLLVGTSGLIWIYFFLKEVPPNFVRLLVIPVSILGFFIISFTDYVIVALTSIEPFGYGAEAGKLFSLYSLYMGIIIALIFYKLIKGLRTEKDILIKKQITYVLIGTVLFASIAFVTNFLIPILFQNNFDYVILVNPAFSLFLISVAYLIVRHQLFGIKLLSTQLLVGVFSTLLLMQIFISRTTFEYVWHIVLFIAFLFIGYLLIREVFREIENKKDIAQMNEELNKALEKETGLKKNFREVAEERQNKIWDIFSRPEHLVNFELRGKIVRLAETLEDAQNENKELKTKIKELEKKIKGKEE